MKVVIQRNVRSSRARQHMKAVQNIQLTKKYFSIRIGFRKKMPSLLLRSKVLIHQREAYGNIVWAENFPDQKHQKSRRMNNMHPNVMTLDVTLPERLVHCFCFQPRDCLHHIYDISNPVMRLILENVVKYWN